MKKILVPFLCVVLLTSTTSFSNPPKKPGMGCWITAISLTVAGVVGIATSAAFYVQSISDANIVAISCGENTVYGRCCPVANNSVSFGSCSIPANYDIRNCPSSASKQCEVFNQQFMPPGPQYTASSLSAQRWSGTGLLTSILVFIPGFSILVPLVGSKIKQKCCPKPVTQEVHLEAAGTNTEGAHHDFE